MSESSSAPSATGGAGGPSAPSARTALLLVLQLAISGAMIAWLFHLVPWSKVSSDLEHADRRWLLGAFAMMAGSNLLGAYQWSKLLRKVGIVLPFWKVCAYFHVGLFFNNFVPANLGGDFSRVMDASRAGASRATAFSTVLLDRMIGTVAMGALAVVSTLPAIDHFHLAAAYSGILIFFTISVTMLWAVFHPVLLATIERLLSKVGLGRLKPALDELSESLAGFRGQPRMFMELFTVATVTQVMRIFVHVLVARALGLHVALAYFFLFVPLLAVIVSLPISLSGMGVREGAGMVLFGLVGLDKGSAFSMQITTFVVAFAVSLIGGILFAVRIPHRRRAARNPRRPNG